MEVRARSQSVGQRGSAVVALLVLLSAALLVAVGARVFGGAVVEKVRCQGDAVHALGSGPAPGCGSAGPALRGGAASPAAGKKVGFATLDSSGLRWEPILRARGTLEDPTGLEYERSRDALAPLFQIVESGSGGAAENQVTQEEFAEIVDLYNDVRLGRTSIQPTKAAVPYWDTIMADVAMILQTEGGRKLVGWLARHRAMSRIFPLFRRNADGEPDPALGLDDSDAYTLAEGAVGYAPGEGFRPAHVDLELDPWAVMRSDVTLYHELIHVADFLDERVSVSVGKDDLGNRTLLAELRAVGVERYENNKVSENAYRAARREIGRLGVGAASGDVDMPRRPRFYHRKVAADEPGSAGDP